MFLAPSPPEESCSEGGVLPHPRGWAGLAFLTPGMAPVGASPAGGGPGRVLLRRVHRAFSVPFLLGSLLPPSTFVRRDVIPLRRGQALCTLGPHGLGHLWVPACAGACAPPHLSLAGAQRVEDAAGAAFVREAARHPVPAGAGHDGGFFLAPVCQRRPSVVQGPRLHPPPRSWALLDGSWWTEAERWAGSNGVSVGVAWTPP